MTANSGLCGSEACARRSAASSFCTLLMKMRVVGMVQVRSLQRINGAHLGVAPYEGLLDIRQADVEHLNREHLAQVGMIGFDAGLEVAHGKRLNKRCFDIQVVTMQRRASVVTSRK